LNGAPKIHTDIYLIHVNIGGILKSFRWNKRQHTFSQRGTLYSEDLGFIYLELISLQKY